LKKGLKGRIPEIFFTLLLIVGIGIALYPFVSDWWNDRHQTQAIASYQQTVASTSADDRQQMWDEAVAYNESLSSGLGRLELSPEERTRYEATLDVTGTGIMGYVEIPKISVNLPVYHGTDDAVLQVAIGHIPGSSLPVGGTGTHCVISGHRGLPSARLFSDIDQLREGDVFMVHVLDQTLTYQVDQIRTVLPDELDDLAIDPELDLCTLVTCTPYGVNTHRLLVRGHRIPNEQVSTMQGDMSQIDPVLVAAVVTAVVFAAIVVVRQARRAHAGRRSGAE